MSREETYEAVFCIVNNGFSDEVMETAREYGAGGGTVLSARGTASPTAERAFRISVTPEKEIVMILISADKKDALLLGLYKRVGLNTPGSGIAFSMPVDSVVGLKKPPQPEKEA